MKYKEHGIKVKMRTLKLNGKIIMFTFVSIKLHCVEQSTIKCFTRWNTTIKK